MQTCYPVSKPVRTASPTFEPVSLAEAKRQLGVAEGLTHHDQDINGLITFAREQVERDAMLVVATGAHTVKRTYWGCANYFELPSSLRPCTAVSAITYVDSSGTVATWGTSEYSLDTFTMQPIVKLAYGYVWPTLRGDINGITITATAGYAQAAVPTRVKEAVILKLREEWLTRMEMGKEAESNLKGYERVINQLRHEVYA